jgi:hypothetical protein
MVKTKLTAEISQRPGVPMHALSRREFVGALLAGVPAALPLPAFAETRCVTGPLPPFVPNALTVDCAARANFKLFRANTDYLGLAGLVSMTAVRGRYGRYDAGNLFLFPWLKPKGSALGANKVWGSVIPLDRTRTAAAAPIPGATLPLDDYLCSLVLGAQRTAFIGFAADVPFDKVAVKFGYYTNVERLSDGQPIGVDWACANVNQAWFGGSHAIPSTDACSGKTWRDLIVAGLNQASTGAC